MIIKKIIQFSFIFIFFLIISFIYSPNIEANTSNNIIKTNLYAYGSNTKFNGNSFSAPFDINDYCTLTVNNNGGIHSINGNDVYSNFVTVSLNFNYSGGLKLSDGSKIVHCDNDHIDGSWVGKSKKYDLTTDVGYGAILVTKKLANGKIDIYNWVQVQSSSSSMQPIALTEDGDYYLRIFFEAVKNGNRTKYVAEFIIPIRSSVYILDSTGTYHVKNNGFYYGSVMVDFANRKDIIVTANGKQVNNKEVLTTYGDYEIKVYGGGYLCEHFNFKLYSPTTKHLVAHATNITDMMNIGYYMAEGYFEIDWISSDSEVIAKYDYISMDDSTRVNDKSLTKGQKFTEPGIYFISLTSEFHKLTTEYTIALIPYTLPNYNYEILSGNRYNNFITKWYEVYNENTDEYYCFHLAEYNKAYDLAMTLEKEKVSYYGDKFLYQDKFYYSSVDIAEALNDVASTKIKLVYYNIDSSTIEKKFSNNLFDGTIYLNSDFKFVSKNEAECAYVKIINAEDNVYDIEFNTPMYKYNFDSGYYTVIEEDKYGNVNSYEVVVDNESPTVLIQLDEQIYEVKNLDTVYGKYFSIEKLIDNYDEYALISVNNVDFYLSNELESKVYSDTGTYYVKAYDRNSNVTEFKVIIENDEKFYEIKEKTNNFEIKFTNGYTLSEAYVNGEKVEIVDNSLEISKKNEDIMLECYLTNGTNTLIYKTNFSKVEENVFDNNAETMIYLLLLLISTLMIIIGLLMCIFKRKKEVKGGVSK